ncbi:MAG: hypothetical protein VW551_04425 [Euryarchaeota archaeon]|jgi:hypothetical protein
MQTLDQIASTSFYNISCKICTFLRNAIVTMFVAIIAFGESAGRARAASELARNGYMEEAKSLILREDEKDV